MNETWHTPSGAQNETEQLSEYVEWNWATQWVCRMKLSNSVSMQNETEQLSEYAEWNW
jgi:hypothetical protein